MIFMLGKMRSLCIIIVFVRCGDSGCPVVDPVLAQ
jgi:hypothetical protein